MEQKLLKVTQVARALGISNATLNNWYQWYQDKDFVKPDGMPTLPDPVVATHGKDGSALKVMRRYWKEEDIPALEAFKKWLPRGRNGVMGAFSERYWRKPNQG